jgi:hypothetical protein
MTDERSQEELSPKAKGESRDSPMLPPAMNRTDRNIDHHEHP